MSGGAPKANQNAVSIGLHSKSPAVRVLVKGDVSVSELAVYSDTLADASMWIAERLEESLADIDHRDAKLIGLYAAVAAECAQVAAEVAGGSIKAAALGQLSDEAFAVLMNKHSAALSLILSQIQTAWHRLKLHEELNGERGVVVEITTKDGVETRANPVLSHLAGHLREAKRLIRMMAANRAWEMKGDEDTDDLVKRILSVIKEGRDD